MGTYSAGVVVKCEKCLDVYRSKDKNSCPSGTKIFSPRTRADWKTFLASAVPLRSPHWIIDVTRPQNGCGGCTKHAMNSGVAAQATWVTSDGSPWWLRSTTYSQPNGDYIANCYMDLWSKPSNENSITIDDGNCNFHARSYYCQSFKTTTTTTTTTKAPPPTKPPFTGTIVQVLQPKQDVKTACKATDKECQAKAVCEAVTKETCVRQNYECAYGRKGSYVPASCPSCTSNLNFDMSGNMCACSGSKRSKYGLGSGSCWTNKFKVYQFQSSCKANSVCRST
jgi:hypothetical protein